MLSSGSPRISRCSVAQRLAGTPKTDGRASKSLTTRQGRVYKICQNSVDCFLRACCPSFKDIGGWLRDAGQVLRLSESTGKLTTAFGATQYPFETLKGYSNHNDAERNMSDICCDLRLPNPQNAGLILKSSLSRLLWTCNIASSHGSEVDMSLSNV